MFNRREVLFGVAGVVVALPDERPPFTLNQLYVPLTRDDYAAPVTLDVVVGEPAIVRAVLEDVALESLMGLGMTLRANDSSPSPWLTMKLRPGEARVSLSEPNRECVISLRNGCQGFVASWALPVVQHGFIGYDPALDLPHLLSARVGEYWCLKEGEEAPSALASARAAYCCFFGNYEERTFERMQVVVEWLMGAMASDASLVFNAVIDAAHEPAVLLTVFAR